MADNIQATPRNYFGGLLTDAYKWMQSPERTQQMQGFAGLLGTTGVPQTIERMAYGEPLTNISRANVPLLKPETADALMTVAPMIGPAARGAEAGLLSAGRAGERYAERVVPQIMERGGRPAQLMTDLTQGTRRQIFVGPESKLWNSDNAFRAANMASKGRDPIDIWKKTGTFKGPDGAWRQEISDANAILTNNQKNFEGKLHETFSHPTLYENYPSFQYYDTEINSEIALPEHLKKTLIGKGKGLFSEKDFVTGEPKIEAQAFSDNDKQTLIHELQHAVQAKENFARGGTPEMFQQSGNQIYTEPVLFNAKWLRDTAEKQGISVDDLWKKQNKSVFNQSTLDAAKNPYLDDMYKTAEGGKDPYSAYLKLGGEAEARAAAKRSDYSDQMRKDIFPLNDYDVPINDLIMFGEHGEKQKKMLRGLLD